MGKKPQRRAGGPVPTWKPGDPTLTVSELAQALAPVAPDVPGTVQRIRHWTRERVLFPVDLQHAGAGKHRRYAVDAVFDASILHVLTAFGLPVSGSRVLTDATTKARFAVPRWKAAKANGEVLELSLFILVTAEGMTAVGVRVGKEEIKDAAGFRVADVVMKVELDLTKLFARVAS